MRKLLLALTAILLFTGELLAQKTISGKVTDEKGNPISNASITVKGTNSGTVSKEDGSFTLTLPESARQIEISGVGYGTLTLDVGQSRTFYSAALPIVSRDIDEVIVTGYTNIKKSKYAGAATVVTKDKINFIPNASFDQILQGRAPGLLVTAGSGQPGASARVQLRGQSSISGGNSPLYILDGMPIEDATFQSLNPNDFEDVQVLRDAVATAQYGNRGSGGVIVITSKRGKSGKPQLSYTTQYGITEAGAQKFEMMNTQELLAFQEKLVPMIGSGAGLPGWAYSTLNPSYISGTAAQKAAIDKKRDSISGINTDWRDVFLRRGTFSSHDVNLSGGAGNTRFFVGLANYNEDGIGLRSDLERYTLRANLDIQTEKLSAQFNHSIGYTHRNFIEAEGGIFLNNPFAAAYLGVPYQQLYNPNGTVATGSGKTGANAFDEISSTSSNNDQLKANIAYSVNYNLTKSVYVGGFGGLDYRNTVNERAIYPNTYYANTSGFPVGPLNPGEAGRGSYGNGYTRFLQYIGRAFVGYKNVINGKHDIDVKLLTEYTREKQFAFNYTGYGINEKLLNTPAGITVGNKDNNLIAAVGGSTQARTLSAAMALANYTYNGKYSLNASIRRDASSQLPKDLRWVTFYAVGGTWNIMKENFTKNWNKINDLRLRVSYGINANSDGFYYGPYGYLSLYNAGSYAGSFPTLYPSQAGNSDVTWEKIKTTNIGLDFGLFKNRISGTIDVYNKTTTGNIIPQTISATGGFGDGAQVPVNAGTVVNKGVELGINGDVFRSRDFNWSIGGNVAYNHNEVTSLGQVSEFEQGTELVKVGLPLGSHYIVKWGGVDAATGAPLYYTKDGKLTTTYSDDDRVSTFGTYNAPWIGGFNTTIRFKGLSLGAFFTYQQGFKRFNNQDFFQLNHAFAVQGYNMRKEMTSMWTTPGQVTDIQSPLYLRNFVSKDIQDASFVRFRNLNLAYDFAPNVVEKLRVLSALKIYMQCQNLYTWTNWTGFDPEDDNNLASYEYPTPRTFTLGLQVTFK
jgi:TonB-linked SusC/RagA family outer membrane protein